MRDSKEEFDLADALKTAECCMEQRALKSRLRSLGLTQRQFALRLGVHPSTVGRWVCQGGCPVYAENYLKLLEQSEEWRRAAEVVEWIKGELG